VDLKSELYRENRIINLTGKKFGRLTVLHYVRINHHIWWECKCECGTQKLIVGHSLRGGVTRSCGCLNREKTITRSTKHGFSRTRFYSIWLMMKDRCYNKRAEDYKNYGKRGIRVCNKWRNDPVAFVLWCSKQYAPKGYSIERINNEGNYTPSNCAFTTKKEQAANRRSNIIVKINGEKLIRKRAIEKYSTVSDNCVRARTKRGWSLNRAILTP